MGTKNTEAPHDFLRTSYRSTMAQGPSGLDGVGAPARRFWTFQLSYSGIVSRGVPRPKKSIVSCPSFVGNTSPLVWTVCHTTYIDQSGNSQTWRRPVGTNLLDQNHINDSRINLGKSSESISAMVGLIQSQQW
jgi:hypothetical protein